MAGRMSLDELAPRVEKWFRRNAGRFGLNPTALEARYILNWGGFVNASFTITDGRLSYHLKLADEEWSLEGLAQWRDLNGLLSERYNAPRMLAWIKIPGTPFEGPLFEHIPGRQADLAAQPDVLNNVIKLLASLHADAELAEELSAPGDDAATCADYFLDVYIERFDEDLHGVAGELPPFVSLELFDWMASETRELEGLARDLPAFQQPASSPTHGDLWASNILVLEDGSFRIIDWDDLALGDPALEYSILLGPTWLSGARSQEEVEGLLGPVSDALRERFRVCLRAFLLDKVIDSLADWVESTFTPEHQEQVRSEKERIHREALADYRRLFPV